MSQRLTAMCGAKGAGLALHELVDYVECQPRGCYFRSHFPGAQLKRAAGRLDLDPRRKLVEGEKLDRVGLAVDRTLDHCQKWSIQDRRGIVQMNITNLKASNNGATRSVIIQIDVCIAPASELNTAHQTRVISAGKG